MASVEALHQSELPEFDSWLLTVHKRVSVPPKGTYEIRRYVKPGEQPLMLFQKKGSEMISVPETVFPFVVEFKEKHEHT